MIRRPPRSTLFPYTTALPILLGDLPGRLHRLPSAGGEEHIVEVSRRCRGQPVGQLDRRRVGVGPDGKEGQLADRKSTRLNSSHANISYAVFCLKKKHAS